MSAELKKIFLELLEKDIEFRYTVAGYLGFLEILKKLDYLIEENKKIWEEIRELRKNYINMRKDLDALKDGMRALASAVGTTLDHYTAVFIENLLREKGVPRSSK